MLCMEILGVIQILPYDLEIIEVLEYFDGDILRSYTDKKTGSIYLEKWCDCSEKKDRFLLFKSSKNVLDDYLAKKISMLDLICQAEDYWLLDHYKKSHSIESFKVHLSQLPKSYLPSDQAFHDESLRLIDDL